MFIIKIRLSTMQHDTLTWQQNVLPYNVCMCMCVYVYESVTICACMHLGPQLQAIQSCWCWVYWRYSYSIQNIGMDTVSAIQTNKSWNRWLWWCWRRWWRHDTAAALCQLQNVVALKVPKCNEIRAVLPVLMQLLHSGCTQWDYWGCILEIINKNILKAYGP